jgi:hypothetical protein
MELSGKVVSLRLTAEGAGTLREALPGGGALEAFVMDSDAAGLWILVGDASGEGGALRFPVLLVRWDYIAALFADYTSPARHAVTGFRPSSRESSA